MCWLSLVKQVVCVAFVGRDSDFRRVLKEDGQEILMLALSSLEAAINGVLDSSIEHQLLKLVLDHADRFLILSEKISKRGREKSALKKSLNQRYVELAAFEEERQKVSSFIRMCVPIWQGNVILFKNL